MLQKRKTVRDISSCHPAIGHVLRIAKLEIIHVNVELEFELWITRSTVCPKTPTMVRRQDGM